MHINDQTHAEAQTCSKYVVCHVSVNAAEDNASAYARTTVSIDDKAKKKKKSKRKEYHGRSDPYDNSVHNKHMGVQVKKKTVCWVLGD